MVSCQRYHKGNGNTLENILATIKSNKNMYTYADNYNTYTCIYIYIC